MELSQDIIENAKSFLALNDDRNKFYEEDNYDAAFEIECEQRDTGAILAEYILELAGENTK